MLHIILLGSALFLTIPSLWSQNSLYALSSNNDIYRIDPLSCTSELVISGSQLSTTASFTDIAVEQNELYAISTSLLYKINLLSGQVDWINVGNGIDALANGLTGVQNGFLYVAGQNLSRINVNNWTLENIGTLGYSTQGDIEIVNGDFFIAAKNSLANPILIKVTEFPFTVTEIDSMPTNTFGMSIHGSLPSNEVYISQDSSLLKINVITASTNIICPNIFDNYVVYGLTNASSNLSTDQLFEDQLNIYQDSESEILYIKSSMNFPGTYYLRNNLGQIIAQSKISTPTMTIETSELSKGVYFITVYLGNSVKTQKILLY